MSRTEEKFKIIIIAALSENHVIGSKNKLPWHLPEDLDRFKQLTLGHTVIMGRKTYESIGFSLPKRFNIVLSKQLKSNVVKVCGSLEEAFSIVPVSEDTVFIIGGEQVYREALAHADTMFLTVVYGHYSGDAYFPDFDENEWVVSAMDKYTDFSFITLQRVLNESSSEQ